MDFNWHQASPCGHHLGHQIGSSDKLPPDADAPKASSSRLAHAFHRKQLAANLPKGDTSWIRDLTSSTDSPYTNCAYSLGLLCAWNEGIDVRSFESNRSPSLVEPLFGGSSFDMTSTQQDSGASTLTQLGLSAQSGPFKLSYTQHRSQYIMSYAQLQALVLKRR